MRQDATRGRRLRAGAVSVGTIALGALGATMALAAPANRGTLVLTAGFDMSQTTSGAVQFGAGDVQAIPADFFGPGSDPFIGAVSLIGLPQEPGCDATDTIIERASDTTFTTTPQTQPVDIEIVSLSLQSVSPITVTYGGVNPETWIVTVTFVDPGTNTGQLQVTQSSPTGGTFSGTLDVQPLFSFVKEDDGTILDFPHATPLALATALPCSWTTTHPTTPPFGSELNDFFPGACTWDGNGFDLSQTWVTGLTTPPVNDECAGAAPISVGATPFSTVCTFTDGDPPPPDLCTDFGSTQVYNDVYYQFVAPADSNYMLTTCADLGGSADYDTSLVVYEGCDCADLQLIACNDDIVGTPCGDDNYQSALQFPALAGQCYTVRAGGWGPGDEGTGTMLLEDLGGPSPPGPLCQPPVPIDAIFSDLGCNHCGTGNVSVLAENFHVFEETTITSVTIWGGYFNNNGPPVDNFGVEFLQDVGGIPWFSVGLYALPATQTLTGDQIFGLDQYEVVLPINPPLVLPPGDYWVSVANDTSASPESFFWQRGLFDAAHGIPNGWGTSQVPPIWDLFIGGELAIWLETTSPCPSDINGDSAVNVLDLLDMLTAWGPNPGHDADLNNDGLVNVLDLLLLLNDWGPC